jgi:Domain of unknown function (DUF4333)
VRTCPACGEETEACYADACTECGFSPTGEQTDPPPPSTSPVEAPPPPPDSEPAKKKRPAVRGLIWLALIAGAIGADRLGVFDQPTGPDPGEVEEAIADQAHQDGIEVTVDCPDDAEDAAVEESFRCTATSASGETVTIKVTNHEDTFEWQSGPLSLLS